MPDYSLSGLSSRSFEQLVQAIAAKVIGPDIVVFGDGPDGGREATFERSIPYPDVATGWQGYGVVQAKFRQRPESSKKDGEWALAQLRAELEKFVDPKRNLRKPEYYILATNVVLTPMEERGSKDRVYALFQEFKEQLPIKGYDVWDYDKIRTFLDGFEDIRRGYAAWITSGDVLARVIEWLDLRQPEFEATLTNFLQKELLADEYVNLEQAGHAIEDRIPLANVFVDLPVFDERRSEPPDEDSTPQGLAPGFVAGLLDVAAQRLDPASLALYAGHQDSPRAKPQSGVGRFVLIGGPGQGKTTVSQFICQLFRAAILNKRPQHLFDPEVCQALTLIGEQCRSVGIRLPSAPRFPLHIPLSDFAAQLASPKGTPVSSLLSYIVKQIGRRTDRELSIDDFRDWLAGYPWLIILDGLDEVPASSNREEVLAAVRDFWIDATQCNADVLVVATTRPQGYNDDYSPELYQHKWLAPLSTARAMHYARLLAKARYGSDQDRYDRVVKRLERASQHEATARLMRSPLQVTIMATLVDRMGQPPQERWNLFKEYYNVIYQRETERDIAASTILREYKPDIDAIHNRVGLLLQVESERSGRTDACTSSQCFAALVQTRLTEEGHEGQRLAALKAQIIEAAANRLVFLVGLEADRVGFEIRSLQEFMAAEGLMEGRDEDVRERLREIAPVVNWRNVFLFAAGKCFAERQHLRDTIYAICAELNDDPSDQVSRMTLAGSQLALDLLEDGPARQQPKYSQSLARLSLRLLDLSPCGYHTRLADLYDPQLEQVYREELERRLAQRDLLHRLGAWACLMTLIESKVPWAQGVVDRHWPTNKPEQLQLLQLAFDSRDGLWAASRLIHVLPLISPKDLYDQLGSETVRRLQRITGPTWWGGIVDWANRIVNPRSNLMADFNVLPATRAIFRLEVVSTSASSGGSLMRLADLPKPCPGWVPLVAGARFLQAPSKSTLARELRAVAKRLPSQTEMDWALQSVPWPLAACLAASSNPDEIRVLASRAEAGDFGDIRDWQAAEERWSAQGVVSEDLDYMTDEHWPFDREIGLSGFPFANANGSIEHNPSLEALARELLEIHAQYTGTHIGARLADWTLFALGVYAEQKPSPQEVRVVVPALLTWNQLRTIVEEHADPLDWLWLDGLALLTEEAMTTEDFANLIDYAGRQDHVYLGRGLAKRSELLSRAFCRQSSRVGVLRVVAELSLLGTRPSVPSDLLDPRLYDDPRFREAAIMVRLAQGDWNKDQAGVLATHVAELTSEHPESARRCLNALSACAIAGAHVDQFLLGLMTLLPTTQWKMVRLAHQGLNDSLRRRTTRLADPQIWSRLKLPAGTYNLIRQ